MLAIAKFLIIIIITTINYGVYGQYLSIADGSNITNMPGDEIKPEWSNDSKYLLFQSIYKGKSKVYLYQSSNDTILCLSKSDYNQRNPVWHPDGDKVVFDSDIEGADFLYLLNLNTTELSPLFNRNIKCRNASFSASPRQVYFTGYNELAGCWGIYSYDFVYDNLNKLTDYKLGCSDSDISANGKHIVYSKANPFKVAENPEIINWYGEHEITFDSMIGKNPSWGSSGLKLFFVSDMDNEKEELYSIWNDGSHLERLTVDEIEIADPVVSPDGTKIAISVLSKAGWDIYIVPFDGY